MRYPYHLTALTVCSAMVLTGCIDNNYDLSDIDTTTQLSFNNLVLPIQLDPVLLSDVIEVKEGEKIQEVTINGETFFAVKEEGDFHSDPVHINEFTADPSNMTPSHAEFQASGSASAPRKARRAGETTKIYYLVEEVYKDFHYISDDVDEAIHDIYELDFQPLRLSITMNMQGVSHSIPTNLTDIALRIPQGLDVTSISAPGYTYNRADYEAASGLLKLANVDVVNGKATITIMANSVDLRYPEHENVFTYATHTFDFASELTLKHANLVLSPSASQLASLPSKVIFDIDYDLNRIETTEMLGEIEYHIDGDGLNIDPIDLEDLPDFLANENTNLILYNPQIYLDINNPVGEQGLVYTSGLDIRSINADGSQRDNFPLNAFTVPCDRNYGPYKFLLAPEPGKVTDRPEGFTGQLNEVVYPRIGEILSGSGLPAKLDLNLVNPMIPLQSMKKKIRLGVDLEMMSGTYLFLAPLALEGNATGGSVIYYTEKNDGWDNEDIESMNIKDMSVTATATSTVPYSVVISLHPLDVNGNRIDAEVSEVVLQPNAAGVPIECRMTGDITGLDGIEYTAIVRPDGSNGVLSPDQTISLGDLRVKVTGTYTKDF